MAGLPGNQTESCANALLGDHVRLLLDQREDQLGMGLDASRPAIPAQWLRPKITLRCGGIRCNLIRNASSGSS